MPTPTSPHSEILYDDRQETAANVRAILVRQALLMQHRSGTARALEFLRARDIPLPVIRRVLDGKSIRGEDLAALDAGS